MSDTAGVPEPVAPEEAPPATDEPVGPSPLARRESALAGIEDARRVMVHEDGVELEAEEPAPGEPEPEPEPAPEPAPAEEPGAEPAPGVREPLPDEPLGSKTPHSQLQCDDSQLCSIFESSLTEGELLLRQHHALS